MSAAVTVDQLPRLGADWDGRMLAWEHWYVYQVLGKLQPVAYGLRKR